MTLIDLKPISVNAAWRGGRRFRTKEYLAFESAAIWLFKTQLTPMLGDKLYVRITIYHPNPLKFDVDNFQKPILDCLVKSGVIKDDRFIFKLVVTKEQSDKDAFGVEIFDLAF